MTRSALLSLHRSLTRHPVNALLTMGGLAVGIAVFLIFGTQRDIWRIWKEASRHVTSSRSPDSSQQYSPSRISFTPFGFRYSTQQTLNSIHPLSRSPRHLSLSRFNYSKSFSQSLSNHHISDGNHAISLPLPATLRSSSYSSKPPTIIIHHSSPDLTSTSDSEPATPTSYHPPVPEKDPQYLSPRLIPKASAFDDIELAPPPVALATDQTVYSPTTVGRVADYDTSGSQYSLNQTADGFGSGRSRWSLRFGRSSTAQEGDTTIATGESASAFHRRDASPGAPSIPPLEGQPSSPWLPGDDGLMRVWTAM